MTEEQKTKLAKESAILCMMHKYKTDKVEIFRLIETDLASESRTSEFKALYEKYFQLIIDVVDEQ